MSDESWKKTKRIPTSRLGRFLKFSKMAADVGLGSIQNKIKETLSQSENEQVRKVLYQIQQAKKVAGTLGEMKGAAMKLGQILSIQGEWILPKEVTAVLKTLSNQATYLDFSKIEPILDKEFGKPWKEIFSEINPMPIAAASIGQVHRGSGKNGEDLAIKVQYPGVAKSITSDVKNLAGILNLSKIIPNLEDFDEIIQEVTEQLEQEVDYLFEGKQITRARELFQESELSRHIILPKYYPQYSGKNVLSMDYIEGRPVEAVADDPHLSQKERNWLGRLYQDVFYTEFFLFHFIQSDPNFANYLVTADHKKLVLLDYGSTKNFSKDFVQHYMQVMLACLENDFEKFCKHSLELNFIRNDDTFEAKEMLYKNCLLFMEPLQSSSYDYATSDLPTRIRDTSFKVIKAFKLRPPPREIIFLNRKLVGMYSFLHRMKCNFNPMEVFEPYIEKVLKN